MLTRPEILEDQIVELAANPGALAERARRGREWLERVHGADHIVEQIYSIYRERGWMDVDGQPIPAGAA